MDDTPGTSIRHYPLGVYHTACFNAMSNIQSSLNNFLSWYEGSVWALHLLLVISLSAGICNLNNLLHSTSLKVILRVAYKWGNRTSILLQTRKWYMISSPATPTVSWAGPCITNVFATCRKHYGQWERSFLWKLRCHWLKFLRHVAKTLVIQGPASQREIINAVIISKIIVFEIICYIAYYAAAKFTLSIEQPFNMVAKSGIRQSWKLKVKPNLGCCSNIAITISYISVFCFFLIISSLTELRLCQGHPVIIWRWPLTCDLEKCYLLRSSLGMYNL